MISKGNNKASYDASTMKKLTYILLATILGIVATGYIEVAGLDKEFGPTIAFVEKKVEVIQPIEAVKFEQLNKVPVIPPRGSCEDWITQAGITESDASHALYIIQKESGCRPTAVNKSSGATGLCQSLPASKMATAGSDYLTNPVTQMKWCDSYAKSRYGSWYNAHMFWQKNRWW